MRKIVTGAVAFAFASALAAPAMAGGNCNYGGHDETAQTTPPVVAQTTVPVLTITPPPAEEPKG